MQSDLIIEIYLIDGTKYIEDAANIDLDAAKEYVEKILAKGYYISSDITHIYFSPYQIKKVVISKNTAPTSIL